MTRKIMARSDDGLDVSMINTLGLGASTEKGKFSKKFFSNTDRRIWPGL